MADRTARPATIPGHDLLAFALPAIVLSGLTPIDPEQWPGSWQRLLGIVVLVPTAVPAAWRLRRGGSVRAQ